jgi:hypothetical protein
VDGDPVRDLGRLVDWDPAANKARLEHLMSPKLRDPAASLRPPGAEFGSRLLVIMKDGRFHKKRRPEAGPAK